MSPTRFYQCTNPLCRLRFPAQSERTLLEICPRCKSPLEIVPTSLDVLAGNPRQHAAGLPVIEAVLDNIRSDFNVGAMFRSADGAGLRRLHLCGITPQPTRPKVAKTSLGAEHAVDWTYYPNGIDAVQSLKLAGMKLIALEIGAGSISLFDLVKKPAEAPVAFVIGNEVSGIDPGILNLCDQKAWIPMLGFKRSLNAAVAFAIGIYALRFYSQPEPQPIDPAE